jgi:hypothetical protein
MLMAPVHHRAANRASYAPRRRPNQAADLVIRCNLDHCCDHQPRGIASTCAVGAEVFGVAGTLLSTSLDRGGPEGDLMELNGWTSPQMLLLYGASARSARARRTYDRVME